VDHRRLLKIASACLAKQTAPLEAARNPVCCHASLRKRVNPKAAHRRLWTLNMWKMFMETR